MPGAIRTVDSVQNGDGTWTTIYPLDSLINYAKDAFTQAGYGDAFFVTPLDGKIKLNRELLARYKNYVLLDEGASESKRTSALNTSHFDLLAEYMDLGGNVWVWAPMPFAAFTSAKDPKFEGFTALDMPIKYFDVKGMYVPNWTSTYLTWYFSTPQLCDTCPMVIPANEQFVRALAIQGKGFEDLTPQLDRLYLYIDDNQSKASDNPITYEFNGAPGTCYFARDLFSEPLYLFDSYYGDFVPDSLTPYIESLQGRVIGLRYDAKTFRSAVFGFSWVLLPKEQTVAVIEKMMTWFNEN